MQTREGGNQQRRKRTGLFIEVPRPAPDFLDFRSFNIILPLNGANGRFSNKRTALVHTPMNSCNDMSWGAGFSEFFQYFSREILASLFLWLVTAKLLLGYSNSQKIASMARCLKYFSRNKNQIFLFYVLSPSPSPVLSLAKTPTHFVVNTQRTLCLAAFAQLENFAAILPVSIYTTS